MFLCLVPKRKQVNVTLASEQITQSRVKIIRRWWAPGVHHTTTIPARYSCQGNYLPHDALPTVWHVPLVETHRLIKRQALQLLNTLVVQCGLQVVH